MSSLIATAAGAATAGVLASVMALAPTSAATQTLTTRSVSATPAATGSVASDPWTPIPGPAPELSCSTWDGATASFAPDAEGSATLAIASLRWRDRGFFNGAAPVRPQAYTTESPNTVRVIWFDDRNQVVASTDLEQLGKGWLVGLSKRCRP